MIIGVYLGNLQGDDNNHQATSGLRDVWWGGPLVMPNSTTHHPNRGNCNFNTTYDLINAARHNNTKATRFIRDYRGYIICNTVGF